MNERSNEKPVAGSRSHILMALSRSREEPAAAATAAADDGNLLHRLIYNSDSSLLAGRASELSANRSREPLVCLSRCRRPAAVHYGGCIVVVGVVLLFCCSGRKICSSQVSWRERNKTGVANQEFANWTCLAQLQKSVWPLTFDERRKETRSLWAERKNDTRAER